MKATTLINRGLENGLTITNISEQMGTNANTVYSWKKGKTNPRPKNLAKLNRLIGDATVVAKTTKHVTTRSINDLLHSVNGKRTGPLVEPAVSPASNHATTMSLDEAHWDGFKEGLKRGMEITEEQFRDYGSAR